MSAGRNVTRKILVDDIEMSDHRIERIQAKRGAVRPLTALAAVIDVAKAVKAGREFNVGPVRATDTPTTMQLLRAYENGLAAGSRGRHANPFEQLYSADWPGRGDYAAAWERGRDDWGTTHESVAAQGLGQRERLLVWEAGLAASREFRDHSRRVLEHQERLEAERRAATGEASSAQLKMPLIGLVPRQEPSAPKRRRSKTKKPVQSTLGET